MATQVTGKLYREIDGLILEIKQQLRQRGGYPFDPEKLKDYLQWAVEGKFYEPDHEWREENGVIYFSVTSDGTTGVEWIKELDCSEYAKNILQSSDFKPTLGVTTRIAVLKGMLFKDNERITENIRKEAYGGTFAQGQKLSDPHPEIACLIRRKFSNKEMEEMGLYWIVVMHNPIEDSVGDPYLLGTARGGGGRELVACYGRSGNRWNSDGGFAFALPQVSS